MPVNLSIKNVPDDLAETLRTRAERNHRSLQGELMAILESAANDPQVFRANSQNASYGTDSASVLADTLLERLMAIAGERGVDASKRLTREAVHERKSQRKAGD